MALPSPPESESFGGRFRLTMLIGDPVQAEIADAAGVDRIGLDIERLGKAERQGAHKSARISGHALESLADLKPRLRRARLFCRLDPPHDGSAEQVERALALGAQSLMLPYFRRADEAAAFAETVAGRAEVILLVETASAAFSIEALAALAGVDEVMIGLNDLAWDCGLRSRFALLASPLTRAMADAVLSQGKRLSIGGLGRWDDATLPVPPDLLYAQYPRLRADGAWLARSFFSGSPPMDLAGSVSALRTRLNHWAGQDAQTLEQARRALASHPMA